MRALLGYLIESGKIGRASLEERVFQAEGLAKSKAVRWRKQQSITGFERTVWLEHRQEAGSPGSRPGSWAWAGPHGTDGPRLSTWEATYRSDVTPGCKSAEAHADCEDPNPECPRAAFGSGQRQGGPTHRAGSICHQ